MPTRPSQSQGFTLIELLVTVLIIGILAAVSLGAYNGQRAKAKDADARTAVRAALAAIRSYHAEKQTYTGLTAALFNSEESTLTAGGNEMWVSSGTPETYSPGGSLVDPRKIRVHVYAGGGCAFVGSISRGRFAYAIMDCQEPMTYTYGGVPRTYEAGTYYGSSTHSFGLSVSEQEIMLDKITTGFDND